MTGMCGGRSYPEGLVEFANQTLWQKSAGGRDDDQYCAWFCLNSGHRTA
jgi:hypothetical protein